MKNPIHPPSRTTLDMHVRSRLKSIHEQTNEEVSAVLALLDESEIEVVIKGMTLYANALEAVTLQQGFSIRGITKTDNMAVAAIIRKVMPEFGADKPGFAIHDPEVEDMFSAYSAKNSAYFVIEKDGKVVGGAGIAPLTNGEPGTCELRKMYFLPEARGRGLGKKLLANCLEEAKFLGFRRCYLETLERMHQAQRLYQSYGFNPLKKPLGQTGHFACDSWYILDL